MSSAGLSWALYEAQPQNPLEGLILVYFGDAADDDGYVPYQMETLTESVHAKGEDVLEAVLALHEQGIISLAEPPWPAYLTGPLVGADLVRLPAEARLHLVEEETA